MDNWKMMVVTTFTMFATSANAQLLRGLVKGFAPNGDGVQISYSPTGAVMDTDYKTITINADGTFTYDDAITDRNSDICIIIRDKQFGAHLVKGQTVSATFTMDKDSTINVAFNGPEKDVSKVVNAISLAYDMMQYFSMDPETEKPNSEYRALLDTNYKKVLSPLKGIKDKQQRQYYTDLNEAQYKWMKIRLIMDKNEKEGKKYQDDEEYQALIADVDVNSDIAFRSNLGFTKVMSMLKSQMNPDGDMGQYCRDMMALTDQYVTNPYLRSNFAKTIAQSYFVYGNNSGDYHKFYDDAVKWAGVDSIAFTVYEGKIASWDNTQVGTKAYDITLTDSEGKTYQLSDIIKGKFTYIDVWATWCGPCKQEIPYLAKLVEDYKDNPMVQFISISIDENVDAWRKMIDRDKPAWPQYNINGITAKTFSYQWGISGIPRFIMVDKNGNIFNADAPRPSEEATAETIDKL